LTFKVFNVNYKSLRSFKTEIDAYRKEPSHSLEIEMTTEAMGSIHVDISNAQIDLQYVITSGLRQLIEGKSGKIMVACLLIAMN
jgi:hypothetical protein